MTTLHSAYLQRAAIQYQEFQKVYTQACQASTFSLLQTYIDKLIDLRDTILDANVLTAPIPSSTTLFPWKITQGKKLLYDLNAKIAAIIRKKIQPKGISSPSPFPVAGYAPVITRFAMLDNCVGYDNPWNNCWVSSMLQACQHMEHLQIAILTVGNFYKEGKCFDKMHSNAVHNLLKDPLHYLENLQEALVFYKKIQDPLFKLKTLYSLMHVTHISPSILRRFILPVEYKTVIQSLIETNLYTPQNPTAEELASRIPAAIDHILKDPATGYRAKLAKRKKCGNDLITAVEAFKTCAQRGIRIPAYIAQNVREAYHELFGRQFIDDQGRISEVFSSHSRASEDSLEAISTLMGNYETILRTQNAYPPPTYYSVEIRRYYEPDPTHPPTAALPGVNYSGPLEQGRFSISLIYDHQINLTIPQWQNGSLEDVLERNFRCPDNGVGTYLLAGHKEIQTYLCTEVQTVIHGAPPQLTIALNRFQRIGNNSQKNTTRVRINRLMVIAPEMTTLGIPLAYELEIVVVHKGIFQGGHYLTYRKIKDRWIEFDDGHLRYISKEEMDNLLHQNVSDPYLTPYFFSYSKIPEERQQDMVSLALKTKGFPYSSQDALLQSYYNQKSLLERLGNIVTLLQAPEPDVLKLRQSLQKLGKEFPDYLKKIYLLVSIDSGGKVGMKSAEELCLHNPKILQEIHKGWIENSGKNLIAQLENCERQKSAIIEQAFLIRRLKHFTTILYSKGIEENFSEIYNRLPDLLKNDIEKLLIKTQLEREQFEASLKEGALQKWILAILSAHPERELKSIARHIQTQENRFCVLQLEQALSNYSTLLKDVTNTNIQLVTLFNLMDFPRPFKEQLFTLICQSMKKKPSYATGEALFKENPRILIKSHLLSPIQTENSEQTTILGQIISSLRKG